MAIEDAIVLVSSLESAPTVADALRGHEERRRPRTDWVLSQTRRRDRTRRLPPVLRDLILRRAGQQIFRANYRPLLAAP